MTPKRRPAGSTARVLHDAFEIGITAKAAFAAVETLAGIAMFFLHADWVRAMARWLTASELGEDPGDLIGGWIMAVAQGLSVSTQHFWAVYLIGHGLIKLAAVAALIARVRWAYPLSIAVLAGFILWQIHKWMLTGSALMLGLSVFDLLVIWLVWTEYRAMRA